MKQSDNENITFENIIFTPLEKRENVDFDLEQEIVEYLQQLAEKSNQSIDNVITHILEDFFSEHLELSQLNAESLQKTTEKSPRILILQNGKPVARVKMLEWGSEKYAFTSEKSPPKNSSCSKKEPVASYDRFENDAAVYDPFVC